jgi:RNA polymerase sigma-70 factor, ECF subfamily
MMKSIFIENTATTIDQKLISLVQSVMIGSESAFRELYVQTKGRVYSKTYRMLGNRSDTDEVLQDVYSKIWLRSHQFESCKGGVAGWIQGIARNEALNRLRLRKRLSLLAAEPFATESSEDEIVCPTLQPLDAVLRNERAIAVRSGLLNLPLAQRECLTLAFFDELSQSQIASRVGIPLGTVKTWISRSYGSLRPMLEAHR